MCFSTYGLLAVAASIPMLFISRLPSVGMHCMQGSQMVITDATTDEGTSTKALFHLVSENFPLNRNSYKYVLVFKRFVLHKQNVSGDGGGGHFSLTCFIPRVVVH